MNKFNIREKLGSTDFLGYETDNSQGVVLSIIHDGKEIKIFRSPQKDNVNFHNNLFTNQGCLWGYFLP